MPEYLYECRECNNSFSVIESIHADAQTECAACGTSSLYRVIFPVHTSISGNIKTVGQLAEHNWKKMGPYEREEKMRKDKVIEAVERREKKARLDKIQKMTPEQLDKWIVEGD